MFSKSDTFEIQDYIKFLGKYDLSLPFSAGTMVLLPWRRIMAGNVFLKNNTSSREFMGYVRSYILDNINSEFTWTLDQNALTYAYEKVKETNEKIKIINSYLFERPMNQPKPKLRVLLEKE